MKIGLSVNHNQAEFNKEDFYRKCADCGLELLEISLPGRGVEAVDFQKTVKEAEAYGIEIWSVHLQFAPFTEIDPSSLNEELRQFTVARQSEVIRRAGAAGIRHFVVHSSGEPIPVEERRDRMEQARKSLRTLADTAAEYDAVLCVEDLPRSCLGRSSWDIRKLLEADPRLRVCFDTNHLLGEDIPDFIRKVGDKIVTTHVSDYDFWNERHLLPGEGKIDWKELYDCLLEVGYEGPWLYEVGMKAEWCVIRDRDLTPADFVKNAREIFAGQAPEPVGRMIENMTFWKP